MIGGGDDFFGLEDVLNEGNTLNMTYLGPNLSRYVNGGDRKHGEVSRLMFAGYTIDAITNGVHAAAWVSALFANSSTAPFPRGGRIISACATP